MVFESNLWMPHLELSESFARTTGQTRSESSQHIIYIWASRELPGDGGDHQRNPQAGWQSGRLRLDLVAIKPLRVQPLAC